MAPLTLNKGHLCIKGTFQSINLYSGNIFFPPKEDNLSIMDKIIRPNVSVRGSTIQLMYKWLYTVQGSQHDLSGTFLIDSRMSICFVFQVVAKFQSARLTGLDSRDGVLLLGVTHFYVIEGVTLLNGELVDIESAPQG